MSALDSFLAWTASLPLPTASFLGSLSGAGLGLVAVVIGALVNAQLNRNRDGRLRRQERRGVATALLAEMVVMRSSLLDNATSAEDAGQGDDSDIVAPDPGQLVAVWPALIDQVGSLRQETISKVVTAFGVLPHHIDALTSLGCVILPPRTDKDERRRLLVPAALRRHFAASSRGVAGRFTEAIEALDREIMRW